MYLIVSYCCLLMDETVEHLVINEYTGKWTCPRCLKHYSKNYRYKNHIGKCLSHNMKMDYQAEVSQMAIYELKQEL